MPYYCYQRKKDVPKCDGTYCNRQCEYVNYCGVGYRTKPAEEEKSAPVERPAGKPAEPVQPVEPAKL